ncbi:diguanylate cyclase [Neptunicella marina]|uniref:Diguanylate cyclase n=1 Tax=Neptunicella marina TaxID=2125989 RepID=A0A8J6IQA3_9ALTE|nr:diguanylate cyclase [Neptunicella marina]MBC3764534.1 diguanylate cyclase [Neptunicella marina]
MLEMGSHIVKFLVLFSLYWAFSNLSLNYTATENVICLNWAPIGIALAFLIRFDIILWPAVFLASLFSNLQHLNDNILYPVLLAVAATAPLYLVSYLLRKHHFQHKLSHLRDFILFGNLGVLVLSLLSAALGIIVLTAFSTNYEFSITTIFSWILGDIAGVLVFAIPILTFSRAMLTHLMKVDTILALIIMLIFGIDVLWFSHSVYSPLFILVPLLAVFWIAMRTDLPSTSLVILMFSSLAWASGKFNYGIFTNLPEPLVGVWSYIVGLSVISLVTAVFFSESRRFANQMQFSISASDIGTWDWDLTADEYEFNDTWFTMLGHTPQRKRHKVDIFEKLIHPDDLVRLQQSINDYLQGHTQQFKHTIRLKHANGEWRKILTTGSIIERDFHGDAVRVCGTHVDVTEEIHTEETLKLISRANDSAKVGLMILHNQTGYPIKYINHAFELISGYSKQELIGKHYDFFTKQDDLTDEMAQLFDAIQKQTPYRATLKNYHKNGYAYWAKVILDPVKNDNGQVSHFVITQRDVSQIHKSRQAIAEQDELLRQLSNQVPGAMYQFKLDAQLNPSFLYVNEGIRQMLGFTPTQLQLEPNLIYNAFAPEDFKRLKNDFLQSYRSLTELRSQYRVIKPKQGWREVHANPNKLNDGSVIWHCYLSDVTERKGLEDTLRQVNNKLENAQQAGHIGYCAINLTSGDIDCASVVQELFALPQSQPLSLANWLAATHEDDINLLNRQLNLAREKGEINLEHRIVYNDASIRWLHLRASSTDNPDILEGTFQDITERKELEIKFQNQALTDELTGIANRRAFMQHLEQEWSLFKRQIDLSASVIILDIDFFKKFNDKHGHATGDKVLCHVTQLVSDNLRKSDVFGRMGGEEFAILVRDASKKQAGKLAQKLCTAIEQTPLIITRDVNLTITASFGVASFSKQDKDSSDVLFAADHALYQAKDNGRNCVKFSQQD